MTDKLADRRGVRALTASERYFAFTDPVSPMALLLVADLDVALPVDAVSRAFTDHVAGHATLRLQVHEDLTLSDAGGHDPDFRALELPSGQWDAELAAVSTRPFGHDRPVACLYLHAPAEQRSRLVLLYHHAVADARGGARDLQGLVRRLDGQQVPDDDVVPVPVPARPRFDWQTDRRAYLGVLRGIKERQAAAGPLTPDPWTHDLHDPAAARLQSLLLGAGTVSALAGRARAERAKVFSALAAGWLTATSRVLFADRGEITVQLTSPVDLRDPADVGPHTAGDVGVIANRFRVGAVPFWELARSVQSAVTVSMAGGEGTLFLDLTGASRVTDLTAGAATVRRLLATAAPSVSVTNYGVLDPGSDPDWLRSICGYLTTTPNHVVFVSGAGYRGAIAQSISTNDRQVSPQDAAAIVEAFVQVVDEATDRA